MKKMNKRLISLLLAMLMVMFTMGAGVTAYAESGDSGEAAEYDCEANGHKWELISNTVNVPSDDDPYEFDTYSYDPNVVLPEQADAVQTKADLNDNYTLVTETSQLSERQVCSECGETNKINGRILSTACKCEGGWKNSDDGLYHYVGCARCNLEYKKGYHNDKETYLDSNGKLVKDGLCEVCKCELQHRYIKDQTKEATCMSKGSEKYTCLNCGDFFYEDLPALGHTFDTANYKITWDDSNNSCTVTFACTKNCGEELTYTASLKNGANDNYVESTTTGDCVTDGETTYVAHFNIPDIGSEGWAPTSANSKSFGPTSFEKTVAVKAPGHKYDGGKTTTKATCEAAGEKVYTCAVCGDEKTEVVSATGHNYTSEITTKATCTVDGELTFTCSSCGDKYTEKVPATGHNFVVVEGSGTATCTEDGTATSKCTVCGEEKTGNVKATGHKYEDYEKATCNKLATKKCKVCDDIIEVSNSYAAHKYEVVKAATCTEPGEQKCTVCGKSGMLINPLGHVDSNADTKCDRCGAVYASSVKIAIVQPGTTIIPYGHSLVLSAKTSIKGATEEDSGKLPSGYKFVWTIGEYDKNITENDNVKLVASQDGTTCKVTAKASSNETIVVTLVDANGFAVYSSETQAVNDSISVKTDASIWNIIINFIKTLLFIKKEIF